MPTPTVTDTLTHHRDRAAAHAEDAAETAQEVMRLAAALPVWWTDTDGRSLVALVAHACTAAEAARVEHTTAVMLADRGRGDGATASFVAARAARHAATVALIRDLLR